MTETVVRLTAPRVRALITYCETRRDAWTRAGQVHGRLVTEDARHCETTARIYTDIVTALRILVNLR